MKVCILDTSFVCVCSFAQSSISWKIVSKDSHLLFLFQTFQYVKELLSFQPPACLPRICPLAATRCFSLPASSSPRFKCESGCKSNAQILYFQMFVPVFLKFFLCGNGNVFIVRVLKWGEKGRKRQLMWYSRPQTIRTRLYPPVLKRGWRGG